MATFTKVGEQWNTNAGGQQVTGTPSVGDLIVVVHGQSGWASGETSTITDNQGGSYDLVGGDPISNAGGTGGALWVSIRTALIASAVSTTWTHNGASSTGGGLTVFRLAGMARAGAGAATQTKGESTQTENPPSITFAAATDTLNSILLAVLGEDNPAAVTPPTDFSEDTDTGWATPTTGIQVCHVNSGKTATTYTWSGGALTDHNEIGIELDTSIPVDGAHISSTASLFAPTVGLAVTGAHISSTASLFAPTVSAGGDLAVSGAHIASTATLNPPSLALTVDGAHISSTAQLNAPSVALAVTGAHIASTVQLFAPTLALGVSGAHIASTAQLFAPSLALAVAGAHIASTAQLFAPALALEVEGAHITSTAQLFAPSVSGGTQPSVIRMQARYMATIAHGASDIPAVVAAARYVRTIELNAEVEE